jgi:hypothetical protein
MLHTVTISVHITLRWCRYVVMGRNAVRAGLPTAGYPAVAPWRVAACRGSAPTLTLTYLNNHKEFKLAALDASVIGLILCYDGKIAGSYG